MEKNDTYEQDYLSKTLDALKKLLSEKEDTTQVSLDEIIEFNKFYWNNKSEMDSEERYLLITDTETQADFANLSLKKIRSLRKSLSSPYFGRVDFTNEEAGKDNSIYIGVNSINDGLDFYVFDWRTPIASLFYDSEEGKSSYKAPAGEIFVYVNGKKQYKIVDGKLKRVIDSSVHIDDDALQEILGKSSSDKMKNIVSTIQKEQNEIIRNVKDNTLIVQGGAGSGKTSVALHRLAYLLYQDKKTTSNNMLVFSPNEIFSEYISNVLPELGEDNVLQTTFRDFALSYISGFEHIETFLEFVSKYYDNDVDGTKKSLNSFKFSSDYKDALDRYIKRVNRELSFKKDFEFNGFRFNKDMLQKRLRLYGNASINDKVRELAHDICKSLKLSYSVVGNSIVRELTNALSVTSNCRKLYNDFLCSEEFTSSYGKKERLKDNKVLEYPDLIGMLYMGFELFGYPKNGDIRHLVIDEAQDYSLVQLKMIRKLFNGATFTVLGDINQTINPYFKYDSLEELKEVLGSGSKYFELNKAYRSSPEIMEYSNSLLGIDSMQIVRESDNVPVTVKEVSKDDLFEELVNDVVNMKENGFERIAIVTRSAREAEAIYEGLKDDIDGVSVISSESKEEHGNTLVLPSYIAKGLEFDGVISYNDLDSPYTESDKYLYYVACTRAQHDLVVYNEPEKIKAKVKVNNHD